MTQSPEPNVTSTDKLDGRVWWAMAWVIGFFIVFLQFDLPNNPSQNRWELCKLLPGYYGLLPFSVLDALDPPAPGDPAAPPNPPLSTVLAQRLSIWNTGLFIVAGSWGIGALLLWNFRSRFAWTELEHFVLATGVGLSMTSLLTLLCGVQGWMSRTMFIVIFVTALLTAIVLHARDAVARCRLAVREWTRRDLLRAAVLIPLVVMFLFNGISPQTDFDVKEYHLNGPKEWFQQGRITFLEHNVYTSFPFLTEMLILQGMILHGDWYWGSLAGLDVLMNLTLLAAMGIYSIGRRWHSPEAGFWATLIFLSTPWTYRISIIGYAEGGLSCYLLLTTMAVLLSWNQQSDSRGWSEHVLLSGVLSASGMACKYPGLVSAVIPACVAMAFIAWTHKFTTRRWLETVGMFGLGVFVAVGPWLLKNLCETGNPVYPLAYSLFGGIDLNAEFAEKWKRAHSPDHFQLFDLLVKLMDVTLKSDWQSPLVFAFLPLACLAMKPTNQRWWLIGLSLFVGWLFLSWWLFTHRLDRFWVPLLPVAAILAGVGSQWSAASGWKWFRRVAATLACGFNFLFFTSGLGGYGVGLNDLPRAREFTANLTCPELAQFNFLRSKRQLPDNFRLLCIGEAETFDAEFPVLYNTVFDDSLFERWTSRAEQGTAHAEQQLLDAETIRANFRQQKLTHLFVNWAEIVRYRLTYGYTDFVHPRRFQQLHEQGIIGPPLRWLGDVGLVEWNRLNPSEQQHIETWAPELIAMSRNSQGEPVKVFIAAQWFAVSE